MKPFSPEELEIALRVLEALAEDRDALSHLDDAQRKRLRAAVGRALWPTQAPDGQRERWLRKKQKREQKERRALDARARAASLQNLAREAQRQASQGRLLPPPSPSCAPPRPETLHRERNCYICKAPYLELHFFYASLCPACAQLNYAKRTPSFPLHGRVAVITGARVKIGYQASLMLLRSGCTVVATTRFPNDASLRYAKEPDFAEWKDRLQLYGLDLRHTPSVELFARYLDRHLGRLDFLLNNAAQTVRRPPAYYAHLLPTEERPLSDLPPESRALLAGHAEVARALGDAPRLSAPGETADALVGAWSGGARGVGLWGSARLSQLPYTQEEVAAPEALYPAGRLDEDHQQVDLRDVNSWRLRLAEVATPEMLEVHLVNAVAPFVLNARLKALMLRHPTRDKHVVNVSAMEGQFNRGTKTDKHPHTNMAKAALNMLTRTSAADYVRDGIHMNSVDTGWVTDEDPAHIAERKAVEYDFQPPLDVVDGAARIVDPIFSGLATGEHVWGKFLKDYKPCEW